MTPKQHAVLAMNTALNFDEEMNRISEKKQLILNMFDSKQIEQEMKAGVNFDAEISNLIEKRRRVLEVFEREVAAAVKEARLEALEEAANAAEGFDEEYDSDYNECIAKKIRSLKEKA